MMANVTKLKIADKNILFMFASLSVWNLSAILCHQRTKMTAQIWAIGHSTRKIDIFISLLEANGIKLVVDVGSCRARSVIRSLTRMHWPRH